MFENKNLYKVCYIDQNFAKVMDLEDGLFEVANISQLEKGADLGDLLRLDFDENQDKIFKLYKKSNDSVFKLEQLCLIENIDTYHIYLIRNGGQKLKLKRTGEEFQPLELVYLSEDGVNLIKVDKSYLEKAMQMFGKENKAKGKFSISRVVLEEFYENAVSFCKLDDLKRYYIEHSTKFLPNMNYGDLYYEICLGKEKFYIFDEENSKDLSGNYSAVLSRKIILSPNPNAQEVKDKTKELLKYYQDKQSAMEKVSSKTQVKLPYEKEAVLGEFYLEECEEDNSGKYYRAINYNEDQPNSEIKIYLKDLPAAVREGDSVVMTKNNQGQLEFYFTNKFIKRNLQDKIDAEERRLAYLNKGGVWR